MVISNKNKRSIGRQSMRTITVRHGEKHHIIMFSTKTAKDLNMQAWDNVHIISEKKCLYLCPNYYGTKYNKGRFKHTTIKVARNGQGVQTFRVSSSEYVHKLLMPFDGAKCVVFLISPNTKVFDGNTYYPIISKPIREKYF